MSAVISDGQNFKVDTYRQQ